MATMEQLVLDFWFKETSPSAWWTASSDFDALITSRFNRLHQQACAGECYAWRKTSEGRLAEILLLDQFSRNIHRNTSLAFRNDSMALVLAQEAVHGGHDAQLTAVQRSFLYMPYMHSESLFVHEQGLHLFEKNGIQGTIDFELKHKKIIEMFSRYPHRNEILGRRSTAEEIEFLKTPGSSF